MSGVIILVQTTLHSDTCHEIFNAVARSSMQKHQYFKLILRPGSFALNFKEEKLVGEREGGIINWN